MSWTFISVLLHYLFKNFTLWPNTVLMGKGFVDDDDSFDFAKGELFDQVGHLSILNQEDDHAK